MKKQLSLPLKKKRKQAVTIQRVRHCCHLINEGMSMREALNSLGMSKLYGKFMRDAGIVRKQKNGNWTAVQRLRDERYQYFMQLVSDYQIHRRNERAKIAPPKMEALPEQPSAFKRFFLYLKQIFIK